jgi:two-component sensor histidine kinase
MAESLPGNGTATKQTPLVLTSTIIKERCPDTFLQRTPFERRLLEHCERIVANARGRELMVQLELRLEGPCPVTHEKTVSRVADELVSNAMEHGFHGRQRGRLFVHVRCPPGIGVQVSASDDGWGFGSGSIIHGNGFHLLRQIGELFLGAPAGPFAANTAVTVVIPLNRHSVSLPVLQELRALTLPLSNR